LIPVISSTVDAARSGIEDSIFEDTGSGADKDTTGLNTRFITKLSNAAISGWVLLSIGTSVSITVLVIIIVKAAYRKIKKIIKG